jgi:hypothetical protein
LVCLCLALGNPGAAYGHAIGENYIWVNVRADRIDGRFEIHFEDLQDKVGVRLDAGAADPISQRPLAVGRIGSPCRSF